MINLDHYTYRIKDPRPEYYGRDVYVGSGVKGRMTSHYRAVKNGRSAHGNMALTAFLQDCIARGLEPLYEVDPKDHYATAKEAVDAERDLINLIGLKNLVNVHANDRIYNPMTDDIEVDVPLERQIWGIVYHTQKFTNKPISHAKESFEGNVIGIQNKSKTYLSCRKNIKRVKPLDLIFLYDTFPKSGIYGIGTVLKKFNIEQTGIWTNDKTPEMFLSQVPVKWLAFNETEPFSIKGRTKDWAPRSPIVKLTPKTELIREVFEYFNINEQPPKLSWWETLISCIRNFIKKP